MRLAFWGAGESGQRNKLVLIVHTAVHTAHIRPRVPSASSATAFSGEGADMDRVDPVSPAARACRRVGCALSTAAAAYALAGCSVGPPEGAGSSATVSPAPASAVITIPGAARQPLAPGVPIRVEASGGFLTDVSVSRDSDDASIAGSAVESIKGRTTAWATTEPLSADETFTVAAVAESLEGETTEKELQVSTAPADSSVQSSAPSSASNAGSGDSEDPDL